MFALKDCPQDTMKWAIEWFTESIPFVRVLTSTENRDAVIYLRTPMFKSVLVKNMIISELEKRDVEFTAAIILRERGSYLTLPARLYPHIKDKTDPWK